MKFILFSIFLFAIFCLAYDTYAAINTIIQRIARPTLKTPGIYQSTLAEELEKLNSLHERGAIDAQEFLDSKKILLHTLAKNSGR